LIIKEKFRGFFENLGIRGKICNILFKKCACWENYFVIGPEKFFSAPFLHVCVKFFGVCPKKVAGGKKILIRKKIFPPPPNEKYFTPCSPDAKFIELSVPV
jgi:hypothetical protein